MSSSEEFNKILTAKRKYDETIQTLKILRPLQIILGILIVPLLSSMITSIYFLITATKDYFININAGCSYYFDFFGMNVILTILNFADIITFLCMIFAIYKYKRDFYEQIPSDIPICNSYCLEALIVGTTIILSLAAIIFSGLLYLGNEGTPSGELCTLNQSIALYYNINYVICAIRIISVLSVTALAFCMCIYYCTLYH
ncbi:MAG: hypothetical protein Hyperionvirus6_86 [Hyperionvirus sp.]|uniref:Uncharacterized protein n=1 Tax=Hyperionvirus sp. TaxID=2487770 RepID=A0A3G5A834_9VIRU|nr:MAG: hypothetical protein Hyperionvirus6_86 [Hyperionvirus sp.]